MPEITTAVHLKGGMFDGLEVEADPDLDYITCNDYDDEDFIGVWVYLQDGTLFEYVK